MTWSGFRSYMLVYSSEFGLGLNYFFGWYSLSTVDNE